MLLDFERGEERTRILVDPWLSDHGTGDAMGRFPRLRFDTAILQPVHAVFLSHAHSDHLDPYTLIRLWRELPDPPVLLLPVTLSFLIPLFEEHLENVEIQVLHAHTPQPFRGVELLGFFDIGLAPTNEDDVMVLVVSHHDERVLVEADANLQLDDPEFRGFISWLMREPGIETAVFLSTENELNGTVEARNCRTAEEREDLRDAAMNEMLQGVVDLYTPCDDPEDLWHGTQVLRFLHGQGLTAPQELDARWQQILFPVRIEQRVREERAAAERSGFAVQIDSLDVGAVHTIAGGSLQSKVPLPGLQLLDHEAVRRFDPATPFFPDLALAPIRGDTRNTEAQRARIRAMLDQRFLPYLHGSRQPPVLHLLSMVGGVYRIRVHYGADLDEPLDYELGFGERGFIEVPPGEEAPHETYWANDLDDMLAGRCDEFTNFCRTLFPEMEIRLWACLAMPLLNSDLVLERTRIHFERAVAGLDAGSYVRELYPAAK